MSYIKKVKDAYSAQMPSLLARAKSFEAELDKWEKAKKPIRSPEQIDHIFETHCRKCPHYNGSTCLVCGCLVNKTNGLNKLYWATTECPDKPPRWLENTTMSMSEDDVIKKADEAVDYTVSSTMQPPPKPVIKTGGCGCGK